MGACPFERVDFIGVGDAADHDDFRVFEVASISDAFANGDAIDVGEFEVEEDDVGEEFESGHSGIEPGMDGSEVEAAVVLEDGGEHFDDAAVVVDDKDALGGAFDQVGRDSMGLHEIKEAIARDATKFRARHAKALEVALIEAADDRLLADSTDGCHFAGGEDGLGAAFDSVLLHIDFPNTR